MITNQQTGGNSEQSHLPFGTALNAESSVTNNNKRFTSYDRSSRTGLDYAVNRNYDSRQGRFTQADPIGIGGTSLTLPQTLNLYSYCGNDPVNYSDPSGLFFGRLFRWIANLFRSSVARRIAVKFLVSIVTSRENLSIAFRNIVPDILAALGLAPPRLALTPSWNPDLPYPVTYGGVGPLSRYIIFNFDNPSDLVRDCYVSTFLDAISDSELEDSAYDTVVKGTVKSAPDKSLIGKRNVSVPSNPWPQGHPNILVSVPIGSGSRRRYVNSSAAGRYQINAATWTEFGGGASFEPANQDLAAARILDAAGADEFLKNNDVEGAVNRVNRRWTSLPGGSQQRVSIARFLEIFHRWRRVNPKCFVVKGVQPG